MDDLDILSYGISMTTLEEVFLKVNAEERNDLGKIAEEKQETPEGTNQLLLKNSNTGIGMITSSFE